ncbi:ABC transporter [Glutamicibacter sp.]|uniref:ABC transporter n=1 Tax=Glutamicibacter sp. TaxID=1931995 RepID=UPI002B46359B|nr:ABC transporter [Glutamicibacter sp.]HJX78906.1 ABC transporter [Glutamicibacter sp.]
MKSKKCTVVLGLAASLLLTGCLSSGAPEETQTTSNEPPAGHGAVAGAREVPEAPLHLATIDEHGSTGMFDLLDETESRLDSLDKVSALHSDGRYLFVSTGEGLAILDSGVWSWNHTDHFHFYRGTERKIGTLDIAPKAVVIGGPLSTAGSTGVYVPATGEGILLDNARLADGEISKRFTTHHDPHRGLLAPLGDGAISSWPGKKPADMRVQYLDATGEPVAGASAQCTEPAGATSTVAGLVIACDQGFLVATETPNDSAEFELVPYPAGTKAGDRAESLEHRKARPAVAGLAGDHGAWVLNTRSLQLQRILSEYKLLRVSAVGDSPGHIVALDDRGRVLVYSTTSGQRVGITKELLAHTVKDPDALRGVNLSIDAQRAYVNAPSEKKVYEIDFTDSARISRTLTPATSPHWMTQVGN